MHQNDFSEPPGFLGMEGKESRLPTSRFVILPVPYEATTSYRKGTRSGPAAIISASLQVELYDEELAIEPWRVGIHTQPPFPGEEDPKLFIDRLASHVGGLVNQEKFVITLGGEHSLSEGPVKAYASRYPNLSVLQIDAHADLRDSFHGSIYSHACAARRMMEYCPVVQVGIRSVATDEHHRLNAGNVRAFLACEGPLDAAKVKKVLQCLSDDVYITIDLDGLDPSVIPAVGTPVPGGLGWWETLNLLREVIRSRNVVGADLVELCPTDISNVSDFATAKLAYKIMGYVVAKANVPPVRRGKERGRKSGKR